MAANVTHENVTLLVRNGIANYVVDLIDTGSADGAGDIVIMNISETILCIVELNNPAFQAASAGVATVSAGTYSGTVTTPGTAALVAARNRDNNEVFRGTVGTTGSGSALELSSLTLGGGDTITINSFTYTAPN